MPRFNGKGQVVCPGSGLGIVHVNGTQLWPAGSDGCWLNDDTVIAQVCDDQGCRLSTIDLNTNTEIVVDPQGANWVRANGNVWAAWLNGTIRTSKGATWTNKYLCDVAKGGVLLTSGSLQGIEAYQPDGKLVTKINTDVLMDNATTGIWVRARGNFICWGEQNGSFHAKKTQGMALVDVPILPRVDPVYGCVPVDVDGELWLVEHCGAFLTVRPANSQMGYVVSGGNIYGIDGIRVVPNMINVAWATQPSQAPEFLRSGAVDITAPRTDLNAPAEVTFPSVEDVPLVRRMFGFEFYTFYDALTAGNMTLPVRPTQFNWEGPLVAPSDRQDLIDREETWTVYAGENAGLSCEDAIKQARPLGDKRKRALTIYQDSFGLRDSVLRLKQPRDVVSFLAQWNQHEPLETFVERVRGEYARLEEDTEVWPTLNLTGDGLRAAQAFVEVTKLAAAHGWQGMRVFATGRSDVALAVLKPYFDRFRSGITATPPPRVLLSKPPDPGGGHPPDPGGGTPPGGTTPPPVESDMTKNVVLVDGLWQEVYQVKHVDEGRPGYPPLVGVRRTSDDKYLKVDENGRPFFADADQAGQAEGLILVPGAFVALRPNKNGVIERAGSWEQD